MKFQVGDRVTPIINHPEGNESLYAYVSTGVVIDIRKGHNSDRLFVQWDVEPGSRFHNLSGRIATRTGWEIDSDEVSLAGYDSVDNIEEFDFVSFIGVPAV